MKYCKHLDQERMESLTRDFLVEFFGLGKPVTYEDFEETYPASFEAYQEELADRATAGLDRNSVVKAKIARVLEIRKAEEAKRAINEELMYAVCYGTLKEVKDLLARGANPNYNDGYGFNVLTYAVLGRRSDIANHLIDHGADVNQRNGSGTTPLLEAGFRHGEWLQLIALLLSRGADINAVDRHGATTLMRALRRGYYGQATFLIERGADVNVKNRSGNTALDLLQYVRGWPARKLRELLKQYT